MGATRHWVCLGCGFIDEGDDPPKKCPVCGAPKRTFYSRHEMPDAPPLKAVNEFKIKPTPNEEMKHWVCLGCGCIFEGDSPPDKCSGCDAPRRAFMPRQFY